MAFVVEKVVAVDALPVNAPVKPVEVTDVNPANVVELAPRAIAVVPTVIELFVKEALAILLSVFDAPLIVLFVNVCEPVRVATVESIAIVTAAEPLNDVPLNPVPIVSALVVFEVIVIFAEPLNETPLIVLAVVNTSAVPAVATFRLLTRVVDVTVSGAVPTATVDFKIVLVILPST